MTYLPNIPQATDRISDSQPQLLTNFQQLNTIYGSDHFAFDDATADATKHKHVTLPDQTATPPTPAASNMAIFAKTTTAITQPYMRRDGSATDIPVMPIKAFIRFNGTTGATIGTAFNASAVRGGVGTYTVTMPANTVPDANYLAIGSADGVGLQIQVSPVNATQVSVITRQSTTGIVLDATSVSLIVLEFA